MAFGSQYPYCLHTQLFMRSCIFYSKVCVFVDSGCVQELEMQARAHGLAVIPSPSLYSADLVARAIKQEPGMGNCTSDLYSHLPSPDISRPTTLDLINGTISYNDSPTEEEEPGVYDSPNKTSSKLEDMLMDNTLSPVGSSDPLLSSGSPNPSNSSGSSSMDEHENGC